MSRKLGYTLLTAGLAVASALARPHLAREPSLGYAAPGLSARSADPAPSSDVTVKVSEYLMMDPHTTYDLYPVKYLPDDPNNSDKTLKVDESAGYKNVAYVGGFIHLNARVEGQEEILMYNDDKTSITTVKSTDYRSNMPALWNIVCEPSSDDWTKPTSQLCALYIYEETDIKCAIKVDAKFAVDPACDPTKANARQLWELRGTPQTS